MNEIIKQIHESDIYGSFIEVGAGQPVAQKLFNVEGASNTIFITASPYSKLIQEKTFGTKGLRSVSKEFVEKIINTVHHEKDTNTSYVSSFQIANKPGAITHGWIGLKYHDTEMYYHITLPHDFGREGIIDLLGNIGITILSNKNDIEALITALKQASPIFSSIDIIIDKDGKHLMEDVLKIQQIFHTESIVVISDNKLCRFEDLFRDKSLIIMKGSFNPLHNTHLAQIQDTAKLYPDAVACFSISLDTYEKGNVELGLLIERVSMINKLGYPVIIFKEGYFSENVKYLRKYRNISKEIVFPIGSDTVNRIVKYYNDLKVTTEEFEETFKDVVFPYRLRIGYNLHEDVALTKLFVYTGEDASSEASTTIRTLFKEGKYTEIEKYVPSYIFIDIIEYLRNVTNAELITKS